MKMSNQTQYDLKDIVIIVLQNQNRRHRLAFSTKPSKFHENNKNLISNIFYNVFDTNFDRALRYQRFNFIWTNGNHFHNVNMKKMM
jgi:Leucine-rich repeat (LRR) protein